jgi:prophage DNA circulation protein
MNIFIMDRRPPKWADELLDDIQTLIEKVHRMNEQLDTLVQRVSAIENAGDSAILLLQDLKAALDSAIATSDWGAVNDINQRLAAQTDELAAAVSTYTPGSTEPTDPGPTDPEPTDPEPTDPEA